MRKKIKSVLKNFLGLNFCVKIRRFIRLKKGTFDEVDAIFAFFKGANPGVMVDVGAHYGGSLLPFLSMKWKILAFEPDPENRKILKQNVGNSKITLHKCAVSDHEAMNVPFYASDESSGISTLKPFRKTHEKIATVNIKTLASIFAEETITAVDFLKIDTEGHDLFVLKGVPWKKIKPKVILCEFEDSKTKQLGYSYHELGEFLIRQGYRVFLSEWSAIVEYGVNHKWIGWREFPCKLTDENGWGNFVAFRTSCSLGQVEQYISTMVNKQIS